MALQDGGSANVAEKPFLCQGDRGTQTLIRWHVSCQSFFSLAPSLGFGFAFLRFRHTHTQTVRHQINQCQNLTSSFSRCFILHLYVNEQAKGEREKSTQEKARQRKKTKGGYQGHRSADFPSCSVLQFAMGKRTVGCGQMWALIPLTLVLNLPP